MSGFGYNILGFGGGGIAGPEVDDEFNRVSFLSHFDGANNGVNNAFDDGSTSNHTCTADGTATQGSFGPFARPEGEWAMHRKSGANYLSFPAINLTGIYTMQFWFLPLFNPASVPSPGFCMIYADLSINESGGGHYLAITDGQVHIQTGADGDSNVSGSLGSSIKQGEWFHLLISRNSSNVYSIYINGVAISLSNATQSASFTTSGTHKIGWGYADNYTSAPFFISNFRITKTVEVTGNFTPSTTPLTAITDTKILTCQSNRFVDNSASALAITATGNPEISAFGPFLTDAVYDPAVNGASTYFSGAEGTAIIITDDLTDFQFGTGAFTVEGWVYRIGGGSAVYTIHQTPVASGSYVSYGSSGKFVWGSYGNGDNADNTTSTALANNQWIHFAAVRTNTNSNGLKIYINGVVDGTFTDTSDYDDTPYNPRIGGFDQGGSRTGNDINAYICDIRVVKGTAVYTGDFTPPTAPLTAITNTKLLLNMADGQAIDSAAQNNLTVYGNAKVSTGQSKFGGTSMVFDETGDYVALPSDSFKIFGTGNFTIECFARFATDPNGNGQGLFGLSSGYLNGASRGPAVGANNSNGRWAIYHGTTNLVHGSIVAAINTWYHVAYVRNSGVTKLYIDGTEILSVTDTTDYTDKHFVFGGWYSTSYLLNGYIDDFRISHMARYTSNFTAPSAPFADQGK